MKIKDLNPKNFNIKHHVELLEDRLFPPESEGASIVGEGFKPLAMTYADGLYHLFYVNNCKIWWTKAIYHAVSYDMLNWQPGGKASVRLFPLLSAVDAGSATWRNGKIEFIYGYHRPLFSGIRMTSSRDKHVFAEHPIPLIDRKMLRKQGAPWGVIAFGVMHPRLFKFDNRFAIITAGKWGKRKEFHMFSSPNLIDWEYKYKFLSLPIKKGYRYAYPSPLHLGAKQYMLYSLVKNIGREEMSGYIDCIIRPAECSITPLSYFNVLPSLFAPRSIPLQDGRVVLLSALRDGDSPSAMALPRELAPAEHGFRMVPVQELLRVRRRENRYPVSKDALCDAGRDKEYLISKPQNTSLRMEFVSEGADHVVALSVTPDAITLSGKTATYTASTEHVDASTLRIIFRTGSLEVFTEDGGIALGIPTAGAKPESTAFFPEKSSEIFVTEFDLEL